MFCYTNVTHHNRDTILTAIPSRLHDENIFQSEIKLESAKLFLDIAD